eukprot:scaffold204265_cov27-Tisochrysis_lutea.AAC.1
MRVTPRASTVSPRRAAASQAWSSSELGAAGSFARAGRLSCEHEPAERPRGRQPAWPQVYTSPEARSWSGSVGGPWTSCSNSSGERPSRSSGASRLAPPDRSSVATM